jgi:hypothetical protein
LVVRSELVIDVSYSTSEQHSVRRLRKTVAMLVRTSVGPMDSWDGVAALPVVRWPVCGSGLPDLPLVALKTLGAEV